MTIDIEAEPAMETTVIEGDEVQRHIGPDKRIYLMARPAHQRVRVGRWRRDQFQRASRRLRPVGPGRREDRADKWAAASYRRGAAFLTGRAFTIDDRYEPARVSASRA